MNVDKAVLDKIKKLMALTASPNLAEAEVALSKAHQILKEYNLSMEDIEQDNRFSILEEDYLEFSKERKWRTQLSATVADYNYSSVLKVTRGSTSTLRIVGKEHNIVATRVMLDYLVATVERLSKTLPVKQRESYKLGIVQTLNSRLMDARKEEAVECNALVVREKDSINQYFKEKGNITTEVAKYKITNSVAYHKGTMDGYNISLNGQINKDKGAGMFLSA